MFFFKYLLQVQIEMQIHAYCIGNFLKKGSKFFQKKINRRIIKTLKLVLKIKEESKTRYNWHFYRSSNRGK